ncbi:exu regulon transcriptional regulator [Salmonella bongori]|nr:exu regulon transcriptional regulator [Salmonella bongori]
MNRVSIIQAINCPQNVLLPRKKTSAVPWFVEAIIMLEVEGYVEVRKGSGIHVISNQPRHYIVPDEKLEFANYGLSNYFRRDS